MDPVGTLRSSSVYNLRDLVAESAGKLKREETLKIFKSIKKSKLTSCSAPAASPQVDN